MNNEFKPHVTFKSQIRVKRYKPSAKPTDISKSTTRKKEQGQIAPKHEESDKKKRMPRRGTAYPGSKSLELIGNMRDDDKISDEDVPHKRISFESYTSQESSDGFPPPRSSQESHESGVSFGSMDSDKPINEQIRNQYVPANEVDVLNHYKSKADKRTEKRIKQYAKIIVRSKLLLFFQIDKYLNLLLWEA